MSANNAPEAGGSRLHTTLYPERPFVVFFIVVLACATLLALLLRQVLPIARDGITPPRLNHLALDAARCPVPLPGQVLIITVPPQDAGGRIAPGCTIVESQAQARQRALLAAKAVTP